jgi:hypothetical protein
MTAYRIHNGKATELSSITFDEIRESIGGYIEPVYSADGRTTIWCNEDGKPMGLPRNGLATALWWHLNPAVRRTQWLVGPVIVTGGSSDDIQPVQAAVAKVLDDWRNP